MSAYYKFTASNAQTIYGYGSLKEARAYLDTLNAGKEINVYGSEEMTEAEVADANLEKRDDIVNLEEAGW
jgi:hypothetical protein